MTFQLQGTILSNSPFLNNIPLGVFYRSSRYSNIPFRTALTVKESSTGLVRRQQPKTKETCLSLSSPLLHRSSVQPAHTLHQLPALELWWVHLVEYMRFTPKEITKLKFCVHTQVQRYIYAKIRDQKLVVITQELITLVLCWFSCFCFFETRFFVQPWLGWNFLCRPG